MKYSIATALNEKMASKWDVKNSIESKVKERVDEIYKSEHKNFMNKFEEFLDKEFKKHN